MGMDARFRYLLAILSSMTATHAIAEMPGLAVGKNQRFAFPTQNFVAYADSPEVAKKVAVTAERYRLELAQLWLGKPLPNWPQKCPIRVRVGTLGAGGATTFRFVGGGVRDWKMRVQGSLERVLDSVVPHEVNHTIFASHFRRPLPRWADEGAATLFEHSSERTRQLRLLEQMQRQGRRYTLQQLLSMMEYPEDMQRVLTLYAQGYSLVDFLIQQGGRREFIRFLEDAGKMSWEAAIRKRYDHRGIAALDENWNGWIMAGSPKLATPNQQAPGDEIAAARQSSSVKSVPAVMSSPARLQPTPVRGPVRSALPYNGSATLRPRSHAPVVAPEPAPISAGLR
ncbi:MAG: hypothetical protein AB8G99_17720 [Planctomycetaceae bacterium]